MPSPCTPHHLNALHIISTSSPTLQNKHAKRHIHYTHQSHPLPSRTSRTTLAPLPLTYQSHHRGIHHAVVLHWRNLLQVVHVHVVRPVLRNVLRVRVWRLLRRHHRRQRLRKVRRRATYGCICPGTCCMLGSCVSTIGDVLFVGYIMNAPKIPRSSKPSG